MRVNARGCRAATLLAQHTITHQPERCLSQREHITDRRDLTARAHKVRDVANVSHHAGYAAAHRFRHGVGAPFASRGEHHDVAGVVDRGHVAALTATHKATGQRGHVDRQSRDRSVQVAWLRTGAGLGARAHQQKVDRLVACCKERRHA